MIQKGAKNSCNFYRSRDFREKEEAGLLQKSDVQYGSIEP